MVKKKQKKTFKIIVLSDIVIGPLSLLFFKVRDNLYS